MNRLEFNARSALQIREYEFSFPITRPVTVLYASDLHLNGWNGHVATQLVGAVKSTHPDLVLLGGDLADTPGGLKTLGATIPMLGPVAAVPGNHESWLGVNRVRECVRNAGGHWLPDQNIDIAGLRIGGREGDLVCTHDPAEFPPAIKQRAGLVLAGHLHGCQVVMGERNGRNYPGAWFFRWNGDRFLDGKTTMLVSRGMNDTIPIRWNCPRDVLLCRLSPIPRNGCLEED